MSRGRIAALLLAAGGSRRMGRPKQLLVHEGESLVARAGRAVLGCRADEALAVVGAAGEAVAAALAEVGLASVQNPDWAQGLSSSIRVGLRAAPPVDAVLLVLADQPGVDAAFLDALIEAWDGRPEGVAASGYPDGPGVPALFGRAHFDALLALSGDRGAKGLLRGIVPEPRCVPLRAAADIDTPDDYRALRESSPLAREDDG